MVTLTVFGVMDMMMYLGIFCPSKRKFAGEPVNTI